MKYLFEEAQHLLNEKSVQIWWNTSLTLPEGTNEYVLLPINSSQIQQYANLPNWKQIGTMNVELAQQIYPNEFQKYMEDRRENPRHLKEMVDQNIIYDLADEVDIRYEEAEKFIKMIAYILSEILQVGQSKIQSLMHNVDLDRLVHMYTREREMYMNIARNIKDKRSWKKNRTSMLQFLTTVGVPEDMFPAVDSLMQGDFK